MLCRKIRHTLLTKPPINNNVQHNSCLIPLRYFSKRCFIFESLFTSASKFEGHLKMSSFRLLLKDLSVRRLWCVWTRSFIVNTVVKRIKRERSVRDVIQCFRQTILRPRRTFFLAVTAAFNAGGDGFKPPRCEENITDDELKALVSELEGVEELSRTTLFCKGCGQRAIIDKKHPGVRYCACKDAPPPQNDFEGWVPYMEAEDVIIWRKEYKPGQGLYAYKVYGRYRDVRAQDFAAVQVDGAYRRVWDAAVAALSVVERSAQGVADQAVLHWEVLWPRLFANRDYVYIRRHKEFDVPSAPLPPHTEGLFDPPPASKDPSPLEGPPRPPNPDERPSVHSNAKRKAMENEAIQRRHAGGTYQNKVFVIISRSCEHPAVPESKNAIRVAEYWSNMVVKTLDGPEKPGMEFVLTYYDEPAVGGMPTGVTAWATGRAAPVYLDKMRRAANEYRAWREVRSNQDLPDFVSFSQLPDVPCHLATVSEQDMESSKDGPELNGEEPKRDQTTQTEAELLPGAPPKPHVEALESEATSTVDKKEEQKRDIDYCKVILAEDKSSEMKQNETQLEGDSDKPKEEDEETSKATNTRWWRYLYPLYYFM